MPREMGWDPICPKYVGTPAIVVLGLLLHVTPAKGWDFGGRVGAELEGLGERFEASSLFDERVLQDGSIEDALDTAPALSRSMSTLGLFELQLDSGVGGPFSFVVTDVTRIGCTRRRNSLRSETAYRTGNNHWRLEGQWDAQEGRDEPAAGSSAQLTGTWDRTGLPLGLGSQLRLAADWSHTAEEDLAPILESRVLRGHVELRRTIGREFELRGQIGYRHKDALASRIGSYEAWIGEAEAGGPLWRGGDRMLLLLRTESRGYAADTLGIPSSRLTELTARYELPRTASLRPYMEHGLEWQDYRGPSELFQDHRGWKGEIGTDLFWNGLWSHGTPGEKDPGTDIRIRTGGQCEVFRSARPASDSLAVDPTFDSYGGILGVAREGSDELWFDLQVEAGRRVYRNGSGTGGLVFEGLNLSLASSDYTYLHSSLLFEWAPAPWVRSEAFLQWDEELHDVSRDDFRLWMITFSVSHPF